MVYWYSIQGGGIVSREVVEYPGRWYSIQGGGIVSREVV